MLENRDTIFDTFAYD